MALVILLLLIAIPMIEISLLIEVGGEIGGAATIGLTIMTAALGVTIARAQGTGVITSMQAAAAEGQTPVRELVHGFFLVIAGGLLLIPGFMTDTIGAILLIPPVRILAGRAIISRMSMVSGFHGSSRYGGSHSGPHPGGQASGGPTVVEGEFSEEGDDSDEAGDDSSEETGAAAAPGLIEGEIIPPADRNGDGRP